MEDQIKTILSEVEEMSAREVWEELIDQDIRCSLFEVITKLRSMVDEGKIYSRFALLKTYYSLEDSGSRLMHKDLAPT